MGYHHLALAARDMAAIHHFYEEVMGFELVKVEVATVPDGGWAKHFFYRMDGDDSRFIAFWELHDVPGTERLETNLSRAAGVPDFINHIAFAVPTADELARRKATLARGRSRRPRDRPRLVPLDLHQGSQREPGRVLPDDRGLHRRGPRRGDRGAHRQRPGVQQAAPAHRDAPGLREHPSRVARASTVGFVRAWSSSGRPSIACSDLRCTT